MTLLSLQNVGTLTLDVGNFLTAHPGLIHDVAGHALAHTLYSHIRRASRRGVTRRQLRKTNNRKRRWFIDNIIMHHKRLHDRNRELVISNARSRVLARKKALERKPSMGAPAPTLQRDGKEQGKWRTAVNLKEQAKTLRGRTDARRLRARSRWLSAMGEASANS